MSGTFKNGASLNVHCKGQKLKHIRIKAGPQRDQYVHDIICRAKIVGRREAFVHEHPGQPIPENEFYSLDYETVDHDNGNSLDNEPTNLIPVTRAENTARMMRRRFPEQEASA